MPAFEWALFILSLDSPRKCTYVDGTSRAASRMPGARLAMAFIDGPAKKAINAHSQVNTNHMNHGAFG